MKLFRGTSFRGPRQHQRVTFDDVISEFRERMALREELRHPPREDPTPLSEQLQSVQNHLSDVEETIRQSRERLRPHCRGEGPVSSDSTFYSTDSTPNTERARHSSEPRGGGGGLREGGDTFDIFQPNQEYHNLGARPRDRNIYPRNAPSAPVDYESTNPPITPQTVEPTPPNPYFRNNRRTPTPDATLPSEPAPPYYPPRRSSYTPHPYV